MICRYLDPSKLPIICKIDQNQIDVKRIRNTTTFKSANLQIMYVNNPIAITIKSGRPTPGIPPRRRNTPWGLSLPVLLFGVFCPLTFVRTRTPMILNNNKGGSDLVLSEPWQYLRISGLPVDHAFCTKTDLTKYANDFSVLDAHTASPSTSFMFLFSICYLIY